MYSINKTKKKKLKTILNIYITKFVLIHIRKPSEELCFIINT